MHSQHWPIESWRQYSICYRLLIWIPQPSAHRKWVNPQAFGPFMRLYSTIIKFGTIQMVRFKIRATLFQHLVSFAATTSLVFSSCSPTLCAVPLIPTALPVASLHNTTDDTNDHTCLGFFFFFFPISVTNIAFWCRRDLATMDIFTQQQRSISPSPRVSHQNNIIISFLHQAIALASILLTEPKPL